MNYVPEPPSSDIGSYIFWIAILILGPTSLGSETIFKEKFGAFGLITKFVSGRRNKALELSEALNERQVTGLKQELKRIDSRVDHLEKSSTRQHGYILWMTEKWRAIEIWAADNGYTLPPPPFMTFTEWEEMEDERGE